MPIPSVTQSTDDGRPRELVPGCNLLQNLRLEDKNELVPGLSAIVSGNPPGPDNIQSTHYCEEFGNEDQGLYCQCLSNQYTNSDSIGDFPVAEANYGTHLPSLHGDYHILNSSSPETPPKDSSGTTECVMNTPQLQTFPDGYQERNNDCG